MMPCDIQFYLMVSMILKYFLPCGGTRSCEYKFSYLNGAEGNFSSPGFPEFYPPLLRCTYLFDASRNGGVEIKFDAFELEDEGEGEDMYDYIDVYTLDSQGFKTFLNKFCGRKIPQAIISPQSKLEIVFVTDHWQNSAIGFLGRYHFLGEDWQPFDHKPTKCGSDSLSGIAGFIQSPNYPGIYPQNVNCSWVIKVAEKQQILLRVLELDIGQDSQCHDAKLFLYNGYATTMSLQTKEWCGQKAMYNPDELEYVTVTNRSVLRFLSGSSSNKRHKGFKLLWMAVSFPKYPTEVCKTFECEGGKYCQSGLPCTKLPKYCISKKLVCDGVYNCGPYDDSDERKCEREIVIIATCISVPSLAIVLLVVFVIYCYKSKRVKKSVSQDQHLTHSQSQGTTSHESFNRQLILQTSFIDGASSAIVDNTLLPDILDLDQDLNFPSPSASLDGDTRGHKKRPSYHMMQQNYEDSHLIISNT
ncbi:membrane frizzled-related protein-like isoform X2 [Biomphalaria pfeifferi]|uniref:Membrane frizzled-related protein-like isoform X2 n=1 Tax=Biomphalaria pfeifferi TaxID=112525 RepID=A0AAD8BFE2_BIOPF|nr:membrane frizzled-related protein-like isoform X2 [Biomphalaria pfeifferi]